MILDLKKALNEKFLERSDLIDGMLVALLAKENLFMLGVPGTGKSAICEALCKSLSGNYFSWLVSKFSTPEDIFGPISIESLKTGVYTRITRGKLPEADIAFLDECYKGSSAILNTLLPVINERIFHNNGVHSIPLQSLFAASNEIPQAEELAALHDRFALKFVVNKIQDDSNAMKLFSGVQDVAIPTLSREALSSAQNEVSKINLPDNIIKILVQLRKEIAATGVFVSDRKWVQTVRVIKAYAYLNNHAVVVEDDLRILKHMLWSKPDQIKTVNKVVNKFVNPINEQVDTVVDGINSIMADLSSNKLQPIEAHKKIKSALKTLQDLESKHVNNNAIIAAIKIAKTANYTVCKDHLGLE